MCFVVERYCGCRASPLFFRSKPKYSTIPAAQIVDLQQFLPKWTLRGLRRRARLHGRARSRTTAVPGLKKVTADASGFIALTPEGMAGTSQDRARVDRRAVLR
jgi:hypothetical protein